MVPAFGAFYSPTAEPYPQAVSFEREGRCFAVASGGGGGAAQLLPAAELENILQAAWDATPANAATDRHLHAFLVAAEAGLRELRRGLMWRGTTANVIAAWSDDACVWIGGVGHAEAYLARGDDVAILHRETTLQNVSDVATIPDILVAALGVWDDIPPPRRTDLRSGDRIILASHALASGDAAVDVQRAQVSRSPALDARALWTALRALSGLLDGIERTRFEFQFDRGAAIGVIQL